MSYHRSIRLADTDAAGVLYFASALSICHEAYESALEEAGIPLREWIYHPTIALPIVHSEIDFYRPLICGDRLRIEVRGEALKETEFEVKYECFKQNNDSKMIFEAKTRHVALNKTTRTRISLPQTLKHWLDQTRAEE